MLVDGLRLESKEPHVSGLCILAILNNGMVWIVSILIIPSPFQAFQDSSNRTKYIYYQQHPWISLFYF